MHTRLKRLFGSLLSLSLAACQTSVPTAQRNTSTAPITRLENVPNLIKSSQLKLPEKLRQTVLLRKGDPQFVKVDTLKNLKNKVFPDRTQNIPTLNSHFGITQTLPQVDCGSSPVCGFERIGDFNAFYTAIYGDYREAFSNGLCAYDEFFYCTPDAENPECNKQIYELKFYGCACPEGFEKTDNGCYRVPSIKLNSIDYNNPEGEVSVTETPTISPGIQDGIRDYIVFQVYNDGINPWQLDILNTNNEIVYSESRDHEYAFLWFGTHSIVGGYLADGIYTVRLTSGNTIINNQTIEIKNTPIFKVEPINISNENPTDEIILPPGNLDSVTDWANIIVYTANAVNWRLQLIDLGGSTVWYRNGSGNYQESWDGSSQKGDLLPEGNYTFRFTNDNFTQSIPIKIRHGAHPSQVELVMPEYAQQLLDNAEKRLRVMERDTDIIMQETLLEHPETAPFQAQSIPDVAGFRIKQQVEPPPPDLSAYSEPGPGQHPKRILDTQNDSIVTDVELLRQKVNWLKQINQTALTEAEQGLADFTIQQVPSDNIPNFEIIENLKNRLNNLQQILNSFYGISTTQGCYNYYSFKGVWRKKKQNPEPSIDLLSSFIDPQGGVRVTGRINDPPENFDYNSLRLDFFGDIETLSSFQVQVLGGGKFRIYSPDGTTTQQYADKQGEDGGGTPLSLRITTFDPFQIQQSSNRLASKKETPPPAFPPPEGVDVASKHHLAELQHRFGKNTKTAIYAIDETAKFIQKKDPFKGFTFNIFSNNVSQQYRLGNDFYLLDLFYLKKIPRGTGGMMSVKTHNDNLGTHLGGEIKIGNHAFENSDWLRWTLLHELVHRKQFASGAYFEPDVRKALNKFESEYEAYNFLNSDTLRKNMNLNNPNAVSALIKANKEQTVRLNSMVSIFKPAKDKAVPGNPYTQKMLNTPSQDYDIRRKRYIEKTN